MMADVLITYSDDQGPGEIELEGDRISFGRGSAADHRFEDSGLSRLHATIYRDGDRIWVVDENSSNGTFVNGERVEASGTPLRDGDLIRIGHYTNLKVEIREPAKAAEPAASEDSARTVSSSPSGEERSSLLIPAIILGAAFLIIGVSAILIGVKVLGGGNGSTTVADRRFDDPIYQDDGTNDDSDLGNGDLNSGTDTTGTPANASDTSASPGSDTFPTPSPVAATPGPPLPVGKTYQQMSNDEKNQYVKTKAEVVGRVIGNSESDSIPPEAVAKIRGFLDSYVGRLNWRTVNDCSGRGWLKSDMKSVLSRARENAPFIIHAFNERGIDPQVGLYLAMIESEHCSCLQSYTGPLGMFQFTYATAKRYGLDVNKGASPDNPDQRCDKEAAAKAAAGYMKALTGRIGTGSLSIPLAIASYNSGEGGLGKNLKTALESNGNQARSFWTLVANADKLAQQFQKENIKYVPKFFAAAIIGENPRDFGIDMQPLSLYTN